MADRVDRLGSSRQHFPDHCGWHWCLYETFSLFFSTGWMWGFVLGWFHCWYSCYWPRIWWSASMLGSLPLVPWKFSSRYCTTAWNRWISTCYSSSVEFACWFGCWSFASLAMANGRCCNFWIGLPGYACAFSACPGAFYRFTCTSNHSDSSHYWTLREVRST